MQLPENHVAAEGRSLRAAIEAAAEQLGVPPNAIEHKLDVAHFRSQTGGASGADTVRIFAWARSIEQFKAAVDAEKWMSGLLSAMGRNGKVQAEQSGDRVTVHVDVGEEARFIVGRGGATLGAIEFLMRQALAADGGVQFRIDVARGPEDDRRAREDRPRDGGDRGDRGDRGARGAGDRGPRDRDRGDRGGDRGGRDRGPRGGGERGDRRNDLDDLKRLARKLASKVLDTGEPEVIRRELNSFERRTVHVEVATIEGAKSRSIGEGADRRIEIFKADGSYEDEDTDSGES